MVNDLLDMMLSQFCQYCVEYYWYLCSVGTSVYNIYFLFCLYLLWVMRKADYVKCLEVFPPFLFHGTIEVVLMQNSVVNPSGFGLFSPLLQTHCYLGICLNNLFLLGLILVSDMYLKIYPLLFNVSAQWNVLVNFFEFHWNLL